MVQKIELLQHDCICCWFVDWERSYQFFYNRGHCRRVSSHIWSKKTFPNWSAAEKCIYIYIYYEHLFKVESSRVIIIIILIVSSYFHTIYIFLLSNCFYHIHILTFWYNCNLSIYVFSTSVWYLIDIMYKTIDYTNNYLTIIIV